MPISQNQQKTIVDHFHHPMEKPRIPHYRDHGFDNMDFLYPFVEKVLNENTDGYSNVFKNDKHFLSIVVSPNNPLYREVQMTVGYIDYQDQEMFVMGAISLAHFNAEKTVAITSSRGENNELSLEIEDILMEIQNPKYLSLYKKPDLKH